MQELLPRKDELGMWRDCGRRIGRERAMVDRTSNKVKKPEELWIPEGAHPAWIEGLREGYLAEITQDPSYPRTEDI